jgi:hypothetical protein
MQGFLFNDRKYKILYINEGIMVRYEEKGRKGGRRDVERREERGLSLCGRLIVSD